MKKILIIILIILINTSAFAELFIPKGNEYLFSFGINSSANEEDEISRTNINTKIFFILNTPLFRE